MVAPVAGSTPMTKPIRCRAGSAAAGAPVRARRQRALHVGDRPSRRGPSSPRPRPRRSATVSTMNSTCRPAARSGRSRSARCRSAGRCRSCRAAARRRPVTRPFSKEDPTAARAVRPSTTSAKYSGGPNASAAFASAGASSISPTVPSVPAMNEPIAAIPSAGPRGPEVRAGSRRCSSSPCSTRRARSRARGERAAVLGAVVDAGKKDDRRGGIGAEG